MLFRLAVLLGKDEAGKDRLGRLVVREGTVIAQLARDFVRRYELEEGTVSAIEQLLVQHLRHADQQALEGGESTVGRRRALRTVVRPADGFESPPDVDE